MHPIPITDLKARNAAFAALARQRIEGVLASGHYVGGPQVDEVEAVAAFLFDRAHAVGTGSGTDALMMALQAIGVGPGHEVIVPALSFFATAGAVCAIGAVPVVVDVLPDATLDPAAAFDARSSQTRAVVPVHLFGTLASIPDFGVPVIDDAAQAAGGTPSRSGGVLSAVSTYPTKTWGGCGDGGFVVGDDAVLLEKVRRLGRHGQVRNQPPHTHDRVGDHTGRNSRLDAIQAAFLLASATTLEQRVHRRRAIAARYDAELPATVEPLPRDSGSPVHHYVCRTADRDVLQQKLMDAGVQTAVYYPRPLHHQAALMDRCATPPEATPMANRLCAEMLALPVHATLSDADVDRVIEAIRAANG